MNGKLGKLDLIIGPMFSGKSTELIRRIRLLESIKKSILVIKPQIDSRYTHDKLTSHNYETAECLVLNRLDQISDPVVKSYSTVIIDEGQFFPDLFDTIVRWIENYPVNVIVGGLDGDFQKQPIGSILNLIPYSDSCVKYNGLCHKCQDGTEAPFTFRINNSTEKVLIGGAESYIPLCRTHWKSCSNSNLV
jgi:thymidine kinase